MHTIHKKEHNTYTTIISEVRTAVGFMVWLSSAFRLGAAGVAALVGVRAKLESMCRSQRSNADSVTCVLRGAAAETLSFWSRRFPAWNKTDPILLGFSPVSTWQVLGQSDASTEWGCGGVMFDGTKLLGYAQQWSTADRRKAFVSVRESTGVLELLGSLAWFQRFGASCSGLRCQLEMDNAAAVHTLTKLFSSKPDMMDVARDVRDAMFEASACVRVVHVLGQFIAVADRLSHNLVEKAKCLALAEFGVPLVMV